MKPLRTRSGASSAKFCAPEATEDGPSAAGFGGSFGTAHLKRLEAPAQAATLEAKRLDDQKAPQRDAARLASEEEATKTKLEKARLVNKPKFQT